MPPLARSRAACMPPIPPPTTRAAPTGTVWDFSEGMGNHLRRGSLLRDFLPDRQEIQGQWSIDHVRPLSKRHLHEQHGRRDDDVQGVREMAGKPKTGITHRVRYESAQDGQNKPDGK